MLEHPLYLELVTTRVGTISREVVIDPSETTRRAPTHRSEHKTSIEQDEDIVHALWRHRELHEQGSRTGRCGWITSFLRRIKHKKVAYLFTDKRTTELVKKKFI